MLLAVSLMILSIGMALAVENCIDGVSPTQCVCGHTPDSALGYGQVIIGGFTPSIISCNNIADGVCPEDFVSGNGTVANCHSCTDADCAVAGPSTPGTGYVWGYVKDSMGRPVERATVASHPIRWNDSAASLEDNVTTRSDGYYNTSAFLTDTYYISASKDTYDTELKEVTITRGNITRVDFTLLNGTCHEDCTNSYNRCNAACDGLTFGNSSGSKCQFFYNSTFTNVKDLCNNRLKGTEVMLKQASANTAWFIQCCGDSPGAGQMPYQKYYSKANTDNGNIKNLIKVEKIAKYNDVPVRVVIAYWQQ